MTGEGEEIATEGLHIQRAVADGLGGIDDGHRPDRAGAAAELRGGIDGAKGVGNVREGEDLHLRREELVEGGEIEPALGVGAQQGDIFERGTGGPGGLLPRHEVGMVLHPGGEHDVAGLQVRMTPAPGDDVDALGRAAGENDFRGIRGVDELGDAGAGALVAVGRAHRKRMQAAVDVAVVTLVIVDQGVDDAARFLRGGAVVKVDERLAVHLLVQDGEIGADVGPGGHLKIVLVLFIVLVLPVSRWRPGRENEKEYENEYDLVVSILVSLSGGGNRVALQGVEGGVPAEGGAFDAGGEGVDAGEGADVADLLRGVAGGDDVVELFVEDLGLGGGLALELRGHERRAGLRDGATGAVEGDLADAVAVEPEVDGALVAAGGIVAVGHAVGGRQLAAIPGAAVVVEDDLLVKVGEIRHGPGT